MTGIVRTKGKFAKGHSGNPGGRPALVKEVMEMAQEYTVEAMQGLAAIARDEEKPAQARVAAWNALLDRAWGKPMQSMQLDATVRNDLSDLLTQIGDTPRGLPNDSETVQ